LQDLIKINTTTRRAMNKPPRNTSSAYCQKDGIAAEESRPRRAAPPWWRACEASASPIPRKRCCWSRTWTWSRGRAKWTVDPFAAVVKDGYIYGRGAIDNKAMLTINLASFIALKRANARLNRDVIFPPRR